MPLLTSPIDGSPMRQISRYGIEIDVCPTTGGVWLDKGELEKLMAIIREAAQEEQSQARPAPQPQQQPYPQQQYQQPQYAPHDGHYRDHSHGKYPYKKKESALSKMMDIFDF